MAAGKAPEEAGKLKNLWLLELGGCPILRGWFTWGHLLFKIHSFIHSSNMLSICLEPGIPLDAWKTLVDRTNAPVINVRCSQILGYMLSRHFTHWSPIEILWSKCSQWSVVQSPRGSGSGPRSSSQHPHGIYNPSPRGSDTFFWPPWAPGSCDVQTHTKAKHLYT